ncbi:hypothetical protein F5Y19DRAFT_432287 [Xylariaceae sp. FL1651]|nr:hypothetical protein F5Y19DRAFT_432287 [Xylariaceae sp. FL1651]
MSLLQLPTELLLHILGYLGPEFFRQDITRLTISTRWYRLAWQLLVRDLQLTTRSLVRFTKDEAVLLRSHPFITTVQLSFYGFNDPKPLTQIAHHAKDPDDTDGITIYERILQLNSSLATLATMLHRCPCLRDLKIKAGPGDPQYLEHNLGRRGYLLAKPLASLLSVHHLTSLELDTAGSYPLSDAGDSGTHLCCSIGSLLPSLRRLRCRMDIICDALLKPAIQDTPLNLEELIINLSLSELSDSVTSYRYPRRCGSASVESTLQLRATIESQATKLSRQLSSPRMVRIISHELPSFAIYGFDALTGQRVRLKPGMQWDADGELVEDPSANETDESDASEETDLFENDSQSEPETVW